MEKDKIKCEKYWPDLGRTEIYGQLSCTCKSEIVHADYTIRVFNLVLNDELNNNNLTENNNYVQKRKECREITQWHFTSWPDHFVPEYSDSISLLLSSVRSHWSYRHRINYENDQSQPVEKQTTNEFELKTKDKQLSPIIVHCSAGIGRSGVFMTIDALLDQAIKARDENGDFDHLKLDVLKQFANIRKQRVYSIERINQYAFVHQILVEMLCSRDVKDVQPKDYSEYYRMLKETGVKQPNDFRNIRKLEEQFNILSKFKIHLDDQTRSVGIFNLKKNRNRQSIPSKFVNELLDSFELHNLPEFLIIFLLLKFPLIREYGQSSIAICGQ